VKNITKSLHDNASHILAPAKWTDIRSLTTDL